VQVFAGEEGLAPFLARTDILVSLLPLTPDTRGILDRTLFRKLARDGRLGGPVLINAGRGGLQVEADIVACLADGTLNAATLDVFETEPLPEDSPLWAHPRVTVTPHNAAVSEPEATARYIAEQILRHEAGKPLQNVVDRSRGY
jgi:glyoxylate/hydroxypyruvate reductase A